VTEQEGESAWAPVFRDVARISGHELRNALNALVVNLEVVRSQAGSVDEKLKPFIAQAVEQSEESVRLAEGAIALLNLLAGAVSDSGHIDASYVEPRTVRIVTTEREALRVARAVAPLTSRASVSAEASGATVILRVFDKESETRE
jgi:signal transduction histidine kinase